MKKSLEEKKEVKKITYEEVFEEALLSFIDEKMSKIAPSLSKEELIKEFNKIKNDVLKSPKTFEAKRDKLIGEYKKKEIFDLLTYPSYIETQNIKRMKALNSISSTSNDEDINFGC